jgi:hypothetical protein
VLAPGFYPFRTEITVAGGEVRTIPVRLLPTESKTSKLNVTSHVLDAEVLIDGKLEGRTPLPAELVLPPGTHRVALRRAGYLTAEAGVTLVEGSTRQLQLDPQPDPAAVASRSEKVRLVTNPQDAVAVVDNLPQPGSSGALTLLPGRHTIRIERNGFVPIERVVTVRAGQSTTLRVTLAPTPDTREEFERGARARRTWGLVTAGAGAVVGAAGGVFLYLNGKDIDDKQGLYDEMVYESEAHSGRSCDPFEPGTVFAECNAQLDTRYQSLQDAKALTKFGWIGVGVGAAALVTGLVLVITGDDPGHYDDVKPGFSRSLQTWLPRVAFTDRDAWILFDHAL